jgi:signal transduction histidine kinase/CheY-like chemotaxis protein
MILFVGASFSQSNEQVNYQINEMMSERLETARLEIEVEMAKNASIPTLLALYGEACTVESIERGEFKTYLMKVFASNKNTMGGGIWYEPFAVYPDERYFGPYLYVDDAGVVHYEGVYADTVDYHTTEWYRGGISSSGEVVWSPVYYDPLTSVIMITSTVPFFDENRKPRGVATADMSIAKIGEIVQAIAVGETGKAFILGADGEFISYFDKSRNIDMKIQDDEDPLLAALGREVLVKKEGIMMMSLGGVLQRAYYKQIPATNWILVILIETGEITASTVQSALPIITVPLIGFILAMISIMFVARYLRRVASKVNHFAALAASGDFSKRIEIAEFDEFGFMEGRLNQMIQNMDSMNAHLVETLAIAQTASRVKSDFLSRMSHEIRTPINAIIGMTEIAENSQSMPKIRDCLGKISWASQHLLALINDVLDMSKIEANTFDLINERFDLRAEIQEVVDIISLKSKEKRQTFTVELDENLPAFISADKLRFTQVLTNLLNNAVKFTPLNGTITLAVYRREEDDFHYLIEAVISDSGIGISKENQKKLFSSFEQVDGGLARKYGGTGLGLAICKNIVRLMGGEIWVESEPSKGSVFHFTIKVAKSGEEIPVNDTPAVVARYDFSGENILLVEDIEINREIVYGLLEDTHISIDSAENGRQACDLFAATPQKYHLILMDMQMPEIDGLEATRLIRAMTVPEAQTIPIVAMTANAFKEDVEKCLAAGMNDHIAKPVDCAVLIQKLHHYLNNA